METKINKSLIRLELLKQTQYNIEKAQEYWHFVQDGEIKQETNTNTLSDGVYIIQENGKVIPFVGESTKFKNAAYVGIVQGRHSLAIALHDVSEDEIALTAREGEEDHGGYKDSYMDAVADYDGKGNTERLKQIGLNPAIQLKDGEYIPTLAELYIICLNQKYINSALRFIGGQELADRYWSSTEYSVFGAWYLILDSGLGSGYTKIARANSVRLVKQFL